MRFSWVLLIGTAIVFAVASPSTQAQTEPALEYDIQIRDSGLVAWLDMAPFITSRSVKRLRDGIDLALEYRVTLLRPKRWWGDEQIASQSGMLRLSHQKISGEFRVGFRDTLETVRIFPSLAGLYRFLSDSIEVHLVDLGMVDTTRVHFVELEVTAISLTDLNLSNDAVSGGALTSPFHFLFRQFLHITDYGREQHRTRSRDFLPSELKRVSTNLR